MPEETFRWVITGGVAIATLSIVVLAVMSFVLFRLLNTLKGHVEKTVDRAGPVVDSIGSMIQINGPKVADIMSSAQETAANARDVSVIAKDQAHRFAEVGRDIADRAKVQVARVDAAVDDTVDQVQHLGANVTSAVLKPVHEVNGVIAGIRAGVATYAQGRRPNVSRATQDEEMFI